MVIWGHDDADLGQFFEIREDSKTRGQDRKPGKKCVGDIRDFQPKSRGPEEQAQKR